jgi:ankyrin repeat protein
VNDRAKDGRTALWLAVQWLPLDAVKLLLDKGADVNLRYKKAWGLMPHGESVLMHAAMGGYEEGVGLLLSKGAKVNDRDRNGATALMHAACNGNVKIIRMLVTKGAELNARDESGYTALKWAREYKQEEAEAVLVDAGGTD